MSAHPLEEVVHVIDRALPHVTVSTETSGGVTWVADVDALAAAGADPLAPWRHALAARQGSEHKPHVAAAFVLQWWCEVIATPLAYAAELASVVVNPSPTGLGFELAPGLYPSRIVLRPGHVVVKPASHSREDALEASSAAYEQLVGAVVRNYAPDVKMSTRQRWGVVSDVWAIAVRGATGAAGRPVGPAARRTSCCFIVALPGMQACAACPQLAGSTNRK